MLREQSFCRIWKCNCYLKSLCNRRLSCGSARGAVTTDFACGAHATRATPSGCTRSASGARSQCPNACTLCPGCALLFGCARSGPCARTVYTRHARCALGMPECLSSCSSSCAPNCTSRLRAPGRYVLAMDACVLLDMGCARLKSACSLALIGVLLDVCC